MAKSQASKLAWIGPRPNQPFQVRRDPRQRSLESVSCTLGHCLLHRGRRPITSMPKEEIGVYAGMARMVSARETQMHWGEIERLRQGSGAQ